MTAPKNPYGTPARCIQSHTTATKAKWAAQLLLRVKNLDLDSLRTRRDYRDNAHPVTLRWIAERLRGVCYASTPDVTLEYAGHQLGPAGVFNCYAAVHAAYAVACNHDPFPWSSAIHVINELREHLSFPNMSAEAFNAYGFAWQEREQLRIATNHYNEVPWLDSLPPIPDHYAHISTGDPKLIAFTETEVKGQRDIHKVMKPGRYLKEYYPDLSDEKIEALQALVGKDDDLKFATTADEIEHVYVTGPTSCMSGTIDRWGGKMSEHPVRAYAGGDLAVAYLANARGRCTARAVVWPAKKVYHTAYGDPRLVTYLANAGYQHGDKWCFQGAKLRLIRNPLRPGTVLYPHIDGHGLCSMSDDDDFYRIDMNGEYKATGGGSGAMNMPSREPCACGCGKRVWSNEMNRIMFGDAGEQLWIGACLRRAERNGVIAQCGYRGTYHPVAELVIVHWASDQSPMRFCRQAAKDYCRQTYDGQYYNSEYYHFTRDALGRLWERNAYTKKLETHRMLPNGDWVSRSESEAA